MAETGNMKNNIVWVIRGVLALLFVFAGVSKLAGLGEVPQQFAAYGYPGWFRFFIGFAELAGGIGLLMSGLVFYAALGLLVIMLGAIYTLVATGEPNVPIPVVCAALLATVAYIRRPL